MAVEAGLFDQIDNGESPDPLSRVPQSIEEPIVVAVGVEIILHQQVELLLLLRGHIDTADVATLEISIETVFLTLSLMPLTGQFQLFEGFPVVVDQTIDTFKPSLEAFALAGTVLQAIVHTPELALCEVLLKTQIGLVCHL